MPQLNLRNLINLFLTADLYDQSDWTEWRYCYDSGRIFRDRFLVKFDDREKQADFDRRSKLTPIPGYATKEINGVKNSLAIRFQDINRRDASPELEALLAGEGRGIDLRGSSMNAFLTKTILPDLLVMGKVGVFVLAPEVPGISKADVPEGFRPFLAPYAIEDFRAVPAPLDSPSDWASVIVRDRKVTPDVYQGTQRIVESYKYYWLDPQRGDRVSVQRIDAEGKESGPPIYTEMTAIPFVAFDILESLMRKVAAHQIALLNMISADSSYAVDSNFSFLVRQRGNNAPAYLEGGEDKAEVGVKKGLFYGKGLDPPAFISPPSGPLEWSLNLRRELKEEVKELVRGTLSNLGEDGSLEAGLAFIGGCLEDAENRIWGHWTWFESRDERKRKVPVIDYPDSWSLKTDEERLAEANSFLDLAERLSGTAGKKQAIKTAYARLWQGKVDSKTLEAFRQEVDDAPYTTSNPEIIKLAGELSLAGADTLSAALGFAEGEANKGRRDREERALAQANAQREVAAAGGSPGSVPGSMKDAQVNPRANAEARAADVESRQLAGESGVRGEGR